MPPRRRRPGRPPKKQEPPRDLYAELGLAPDASAEDIKRAYRSLALLHHPDKVPSSQREEATAKLASINTAWDVLGDTERRRVYDLQRAADGGADKVGRQGRGLPSFLRRHVLGAEARSLAWWSGVPYLHQHSMGRLQSAMARRQPCLLFLHLGGSPRSERSAPAIVEAHRRLRGAAFVAAVDVETQPELAKMLQPSGGFDDGSSLPAALLIAGDQGARRFEAPLNGSTLVAEVLRLLPDLPRVCTRNQFRELRETAKGAHGRNRGVPVVGVVLAVRGGNASQAARVGCSASRRLLCAKVTHANCALPSEVMACPGLALVSANGAEEAPGGPDGPGGPALLSRCVTEYSAMLDALEEHGTRAALGRSVGGLSTLVRRAATSPPVRVAAAVAGDLRTGTLVAGTARALSPVAQLGLGLLATAQGPIIMAALGLGMLYAGRALRPKPKARGRRLGSRRRYAL